MPIYEYECNACRQRFEKLQSFSEEPVRVCPHCGGETRRVLQPVGVIFKGSGWYITDSRKNTSGAGTAKAESGSEPAGTSGSGDSAGASGSGGAGDSAPAPQAPATSGGDD
jgi:putative FmdB family regulatory protein